MMLERVAAFVERQRMFAPQQRVGVAVSGGADSVCLLYALAELAPRWGLALTVLHLDHGLRGEDSRRDAEFVRELAGRLGLPFELTVAPPLVGNLEEAGREARRAFFRELLAAGRLDRVALGHTRSDQAETVLFRLLRGSGTTGCAAMRPVTPDGLVRPLLAEDRDAIRAFLTGRGIAWREDTTNRNPAFARNRIRHGLLPQLARDWNPEITAALARAAELFQEDEDYWRAEVERLAPALMRIGPQEVVLDAGQLARLPPALGRRVARHAVERARGGLRGVDFSHITHLLALAGAGRGAGRLQLPGLEVARSFGLLRLARPENPSADWQEPLTVPGRFPLPGGKSFLCLQFSEGSRYTEGEGELDWSRLTGALAARNWRPGDRFHGLGHSGDEKLKVMFHKARVPRWERRNWPVVVMAERIVWTRRFGAAAEFHAGPATSRRLRVWETEEGE